MKFKNIKIEGLGLILLMIMSITPAFALLSDIPQAEDNEQTLTENSYSERQSRDSNHIMSSKELDNNYIPEKSSSQANPAINMEEVPTNEERADDENPAKNYKQGQLNISALYQGHTIDTKVKIYFLEEDGSENLIRTLQSHCQPQIVDLDTGYYIVEVGDIHPTRSDPIYVRNGFSEDYQVELSMIELSPYSFDAATSEKVALESSNGEVYWEGSIVKDTTMQLYGSTGTYFLHHYQLNRRYSYEIGEYATIPVLMVEDQKLTQDRFSALYPPRPFDNTPISVDADAGFGDLRVYADTFDNMPLDNVRIDVLNATAGTQTVVATTTTGVTGFGILTLAPENYTVKTYKSNAAFDFETFNVTITANTEYWVNDTFNLIRFWDENATNSRVYMYNQEGSQIYYEYPGADQYVNIWTGPHNVGLLFESTWYNRTVTTGEFVEINQRNEIAPQLDRWDSAEPVQIAKRIGANDQTDITMWVIDQNYDFPVTATFTPNTGSVSAASFDWVRFQYQSATVTYSSPASSDLYFVDILVEDGAGLNDSYRVYLSNRTVSIEIQSEYNGSMPVDSRINYYTGTAHSQYISYVYTSGDGTHTFNLYEGEYYFTVIESNNIYIRNQLYNASVGSYIHTATWAYITFNSTREFGKPLGTAIYGLNSTQPGNNEFYASTSSTTGLVNVLVAPGTNFEFRGDETTSIHKYNQTMIANGHQQVDFQFSTLAAYTFDAGSPQDIRVNLYNGTALAQGASYITYGYTGSDGIIAWYLAPYTNYTVYIYDTPAAWITNIVTTANTAEAVHEFTNSAPVISGITASPRRIGPTENTTITVTASDIDAIDLMDYSWKANVGTIMGSGSSVLYIAPASINYYRIDVNVTDQYGGMDQIHIYVSNNTATITINSTTFDGTPYNNRYNLYQLVPYEYVTYKYSGASGLVDWIIYDGEYRLSGVGSNNWDKEFFVFNNDSQIDYSWGGVIANTTTENGTPFSGRVTIYDSTRTVQEVDTSVGADGRYNFHLRPDTYDFFAQASGNGMWLDDIVVTPNQNQTLNFEFAQLAFNITTSYYNPRNIRVNLYTTVDNISYDYKTYIYPSYDGYGIYNVAPGNYSLYVYTDPGSTYNNLIVSASEYLLTEVKLARVNIYANNGTYPQNLNFKIYQNGSTSTVFNTYTGNDGFYAVDLVAGVYDIDIGSTRYEDVVISEHQRAEIGTRLPNYNPVINSLSKSVNYIGPDSQSTITLDVTDTNYDYGNFTFELDVSVGFITNLYDINHFISSGEYRIGFTYNSPSYLDVYSINITLYDGYGGYDTYRVFLSDQDNTLNIFTKAGNDVNENTGVTIYDVESGNSVISTSTGTDGYHQFVVKDGWYNIKFDEFTDIWHELVIYGGVVQNITASFATVDIYSSGSGGVPLNSRVNVYNNTNGAYINYAFTSSSTGLARFILAPGSYKFVVREATDIILFADVVGGTNAILGGEVPNLTNNPENLVFYWGDTGQTLSWSFSDDTNPDKYIVTANGTEFQSGTWNGQTLTINFDSLFIGFYEIKAEVNDTFGYYNYDFATVTVLQPDAPSVANVADITLPYNTTTQLGWIVNSRIPDQYTIYLNNVSVDTGYWSDGATITYKLETPDEGSYNLTIVITDDLGRSSYDQAIITVNADPVPMISSGTIIEEYDDQWVDVTFTISDNNLNYYEIWVDQVLMDNNTNVPSELIYLLGYDEIRSYNVTVVVVDWSYQTNRSVNIVTVYDSIAPDVEWPADQIIEFGIDSPSYTWNFTDASTQQYLLNYQLIVNQALWESGTADSSWTYQFSGLAKGEYIVQLIVQDWSNNVNTTTFTLNVVDTLSPLITDPSRSVIEYKFDDPLLNWEIEDYSPMDYILYLDSDIVDQGSWTDFTNQLVYNTFPLGLGSFNFTLQVMDESGNTASVENIILISDSVAPIVSTPSNQTLEYGISSATVSWTVIDSSNITYTIYVNGEAFRSSSPGDPEPVNFDLMEPEVGTYNVTIEVTDDDNNSVLITSFVVIQDTTAPSISSSKDLVLLPGASPPLLEFNISDLSLFTYELRGDNVVLDQGNGSTVHYTMENTVLSAGDYSFVLTVTDLYGNEQIAEVMVTILPDNLRFIEAPEPMVLPPTQMNPVLNFTGTSYIADEYEVYVNGSLEYSAAWQANMTSLFNISSYLVEGGNIEVELVLYNQLGESVRHNFTIEVLETDQEDNILDNLTTGQIIALLLTLLVALIAIARSGGNAMKYGRAF